MHCVYANIQSLSIDLLLCERLPYAVSSERNAYLPLDGSPRLCDDRFHSIKAGKGGLHLSVLQSQQDVEKVHQLCSRVVQRLNVRPNVCFAFSLAAASLDGLFEHPPTILVRLAAFKISTVNAIQSSSSITY